MNVVQQPRQVLLALLMIISNISQASEPIKFDVLLIAYDQGESNAIKQLEPELKRAQLHYRIFSFGRAAELFDQNPLNISPPESHNMKNDRNALLPKERLSELSHSLSPRVVFTGMSSAAQAQLINAFKRSGSTTIAFYDDFDPISEKEYVQPFLNASPNVDQFHVPSEITGQSFQATIKKTNAKLKVTGQPALEVWDSIYESVNPEDIRKLLSLPVSKPVVLFAGGYDDTYQPYLEVFLEATQQLPEFEFLVTYHPKTNGHLERELINKLAQSNVTLIETGSFSTAVLSTLASVVAVHKSSIGTMARYKNKPVLFVAEPGFSNFLLNNKLACLASKPEEVSLCLKENINVKQPSFAKKIKISSRPSVKITQLLTQVIKSRQNNK